MRLLVLVLMLLQCGNASGSDLKSLAVCTASSYLYVREKTGNNDAPEIDLWLKEIGLPKGLAYCAAFVVHCYNRNQRGTLPKIGRCSTLLHTVEKNPIKYDVFSAKSVAFGSRSLKSGDIEVWVHGKDVSPSSNFSGHFGIVEVDGLVNGKSRTIEGNTTIQQARSSAEDRGGSGSVPQGVARKARGFGGALWPTAFIRIKG